MRRFLAWLNEKLGIVETDPEKNAMYDRMDQALDRRARRRGHEGWAAEMDRDMDEHPEWFGMVHDEMGNSVERRDRS